MAGRTNGRFREHVTRVGFDLSLSRSNITALVQLDQMLAHDAYLGHLYRDRARAAKQSDNFVTGTTGLERRGLTVHIYERNKARIKKWNVTHEHMIGTPPHLVWQITEAGRLVIELLKVAGLYGKYALPEAEVAAEADRQHAKIREIDEQARKSRKRAAA